LRAQQESGAISFSQQSASNYMRLAANYQRVGNLDKVPSIRAALELLSDNNPEQEQPELSGVEPEYPLAIAEPPSAQVVKTMLTALSSDDQWSIISSMWADLNAARTEQRRQERLEKLAAISRGNTELETDILSDHLRRSALEI
jgi:hypothetical protein